MRLAHPNLHPSQFSYNFYLFIVLLQYLFIHLSQNLLQSYNNYPVNCHSGELDMSHWVFLRRHTWRSPETSLSKETEVGGLLLGSSYHLKDGDERRAREQCGYVSMGLPKHRGQPHVLKLNLQGIQKLCKNLHPHICTHRWLESQGEERRAQAPSSSATQRLRT